MLCTEENKVCRQLEGNIRQFRHISKFNGLFSKTTWVGRHQKGKPFLILLEQMMGWQWHQLDHMQIICTSLQTDNHTSTSPLSFYRPDALPAAQPTASKHWRHSAKFRHICVYVLLCCSGFKKRAPRAIKEIRKFAEKMMGTADVRIDTRLNKHMWSQGIRYDNVIVYCYILHLSYQVWLKSMMLLFRYVDNVRCSFVSPRPQPFYGPFSGTTRMSWCQKRTSGVVQG